MSRQCWPVQSEVCLHGHRRCSQRSVGDGHTDVDDSNSEQDTSEWVGQPRWLMPNLDLENGGDTDTFE